MAPGDEAPLLADGQFRAALGAMQDHVAIGAAVRVDGEIVDFVLLFVNVATVDGAGRSVDELEGNLVCELYPGWVESGMLARFAAVVESGEPFVDDRVRYEDVAPDGTVITGWWSISVAPFGDGYIASSRDVTESVRAEEARRAVAAEVEVDRMAVAMLQRVALPSRLPDVPGLAMAARYEPAHIDQPVGGDWYDVIPLDDGRVGLVIADVAGHGPDAAAAMVQVRNVVRALAIEHGEPHLVLGRANQIVTRLDEASPFATCCYLVLDVAGGSCRWAVAGHLPPLLIEGSSGRARYLTAPVGPPLGVNASATYETAAAPLAPGDQLVLFTDGLVEVRDQSVEASLDALAGWLDGAGDRDVEDLADAIVARSGAHQDDVALLVIGRIDAP